MSVILEGALPTRTGGGIAIFESGVYAGSTFVSFRGFGRHLRARDSSERCGFARPGASCDDA